MDASDSAISVLKGGWCASKTPFANVRTDGCYALAGSVEHEMARSPPVSNGFVCPTSLAKMAARETCRL